MEAAVKSIKSLVSVLPDRPHQLSITPDEKYHLQPNDTRLEEDVIRPLQYMTYLFGVDRGLLVTRAYSDIRDEDSHAPKPIKPPPADPSKPRTKFSLSDYNKKKKQENNSTESNSATPVSKSITKPADKERRPALKKEESPSVDSMLKQAISKRAHPSLPPKPDVRRPGAEPSPERKKRPSDVVEDRAVKRTKTEGTPNALSRGSSKLDTPSRGGERTNGHEKKLSKELKPSPMPATNGRSVLSNSSTRGVSPRASSLVNGSTQKSVTSKDSTPKKEKLKSGPKEFKSIPMLSPLGPELGSRIPGYEKSPQIKPIDKDVKLQSKRLREEGEASLTPKSAKPTLPPLLSPTLPPIVREAQALSDKDKKFSLSKDSSQRNPASADSSSSAKKAPVRTVKEETDHGDVKKEVKNVPTTRLVKLKYPKRLAKTISRLLALAPKKKPEAPKRELLEPPKRDDRTGRERSESAEPPSTSTARKRPRSAADVGEQPSAMKRPRTSEITQPSTPSKHTTAMQRVASSSSQAGTPGVVNNLTPAAPVPDLRRSVSVDPERASRLRQQHATLTALGTRLKHKRDRIIKPEDGSSMPPKPSVRDRNALMAIDLQSIVAYMAGFRAMDDMRDAERKARDPNMWRSLQPLMRVYKADISNSIQLIALLTRLNCIVLLWHARSLVSLGPENANNARELFQNAKEQDQMWRLAGDTRKRLEDSQSGDDVARLVDRLGPWSSPEDVVGVTLKILRKVSRNDNEKFTPEPELIQACEPIANGV